MQVFLPAIAGHVPPQMVRAISAFMEFCYLARRSQIDEDTLSQLDAAIACFHHEREIFKIAGVREDFSLPRQHSLCHYLLQSPRSRSLLRVSTLSYHHHARCISFIFI